MKFMKIYIVCNDNHNQDDISEGYYNKSIGEADVKDLTATSVCKQWYLQEIEIVDTNNMIMIKEDAIEKLQADINKKIKSYDEDLMALTKRIEILQKENDKLKQFEKLVLDFLKKDLLNKEPTIETEFGMMTAILTSITNDLSDGKHQAFVDRWDKDDNEMLEREIAVRRADIMRREIKRMEDERKKKGERG